MTNKIDIPNPKVQPDKPLAYTLFNTPSKGNANQISAMNNVFQSQKNCPEKITKYLKKRKQNMS